MRLSPFRCVVAAILLLFAPALGAQAFRIDEWRAYAILGSPGLEPGTDYAAFTGHHGIQSDWLPDGKITSDYVEQDASLLSHFQLRVINLGAPLPGLLGTPISKQIDDVVLASLTRPHYDLASRANNHAFDLGAEGMRYYEQKLDAAGIRIVGQRGFPVFHWRVGAHRIDIAALADVLDKPDPDGWILLMSDANLEAAKREMQGADYRIVLAHLGSASRYPSPHEREQVVRLQKAGFDLVVATGAHFVKGVLVEEGRPVAYGLGDHFLSVVYDPKTGTEPVGMHLVSGFRDARLVQLFVVPFHNDLRRGILGPLDEAAFGEFVKTLKERSTADASKYYSDGSTFEMMVHGIRGMNWTDVRRLRPRHFVYGAQLLLRQRPEWVAGAGIFAAAIAVMLYRRRSVRRRANSGTALESSQSR